MGNLTFNRGEFILSLEFVVVAVPSPKHAYAARELSTQHTTTIKTISASRLAQAILLNGTIRSITRSRVFCLESIVLSHFLAAKLASATFLHDS